MKLVHPVEIVGLVSEWGKRWYKGETKMGGGGVITLAGIVCGSSSVNINHY